LIAFPFGLTHSTFHFTNFVLDKIVKDIKLQAKSTCIADIMMSEAETYHALPKMAADLQSFRMHTTDRVSQ
jgi:hypothetical protein